MTQQRTRPSGDSGGQPLVVPPPEQPGYSERKSQVLARLRRVEGQVKGLSRMVEDDVYCIDVLTQVSATTKALQAVALQLLEEHLAHCVVDAAREGGEVAEARLDEVNRAVARLLRT